MGRRITKLQQQFQSTLRARRSDNRKSDSRDLRVLFQSTLRARRSDAFVQGGKLDDALFQSTLRARRSDRQSSCSLAQANISIHAPREAERRLLGEGWTVTDLISIHAPREAERRIIEDDKLLPYFISIHAPREAERLHNISREKTNKNNFNPRSARGGATFRTR